MHTSARAHIHTHTHTAIGQSFGIDIERKISLLHKFVVVCVCVGEIFHDSLTHRQIGVAKRIPHLFNYSVFHFRYSGYGNNSGKFDTCQLVAIGNECW